MAISRPKKIIRLANATPQTVAELINHHMAEIAGLFDNPKVTLIVRSPTLEGDLIFTNDDPGEAVLAIKKMTTPLNNQAVVRAN